MSSRVTVHVNRGAADSLETAVSSLETTDSFALRLESYGPPAHVHCRLEGDLARIATLEESNYYVEADGRTIVPIHVTAERIDGPVEGELEVVTGYGSESLSIPVTVDPSPDAIDVDESLGKPHEPGPEPTVPDRVLAGKGLDPATLAVVALGLVAIGIATTSAATLGGSVALTGLVVVAAGFCVALLLLLW